MHVNSLPAISKIHRQMEHALNKVYINAGKRHLRVFRRLLRKHNTRNHKITVEGGMGMYYVAVNGKHLLDRKHYQYRATPVYELLHDIQDAFLSDWDWTLEGESLNS